MWKRTRDASRIDELAKNLETIAGFRMASGDEPMADRRDVPVPEDESCNKEDLVPVFAQANESRFRAQEGKAVNDYFEKFTQWYKN